MKIMIVTDAWEPQVNGVVRTLKQTCHELRLMGHEIEMITPINLKRFLALLIRIFLYRYFLGKA
jgi:hypothetical protein